MKHVQLISMKLLWRKKLWKNNIPICKQKINKVLKLKKKE